MQTQTTTRLKRYERHRFRKPVLVLQPRDHEIVKVVARHRVITSEDIQRLVPGSDQTILRRLQRLFHNGYLDRPKIQRVRGNTPMVYALGAKGAELIASETDRKRGIDWAEKNRQLSASFLEHALMISRFQAALSDAVSSKGILALEYWVGDGRIKDSVVVEHEASRERIPIAPDALFGIRLLNEPDGRNRVHVFLEADRGTMTSKRFFTKMRGYWHWWRSGRHERMGIKNFLVLTITRTSERASNLRTTTKALDAPRHRGLRMFLFGSEQEYTDNKTIRILDPIWTTPSDEGRHSILE